MKKDAQIQNDLYGYRVKCIVSQLSTGTENRILANSDAFQTENIDRLTQIYI